MRTPLRRRARITAALLLLALPGLAQEAQRESVERLCVELRERGFEIELEGLGVEVAERERTLADIDRQQDLFFPEEHFQCVHVLLNSFGLGLPTEAKALRRAVVQSYASVLRAYYQYDRDAMVFRESELDQILGIEPIVVHELAHAWRDQHHGIDRLMAGRVRTTESVRVAQCLLEGEAEVIALDVLVTRAGRKLEDLDPDDLTSAFEELLAGSLALIYQEGRAFMLRRYQEGGWEAVHACFDERPASTEQIMHPSKLRLDRPVDVPVPPWPVELGAAQACREDVIGELGMLALLLGAGAEREAAFPGTIGWDGDRIVTYALEDGGYACVWRSVWDREEDADQFAKVLRKVVEGRARVSGRVVEWVVAPSRDVSRALLRNLRQHPFEVVPVEEDAVTTTAIEEAWRRENDRTPAVVDGVWVHPRHGLRIPVPEGWEEVELNGVRFLMAARADGFRDNVSVVEAPFLGEDLADLRAEIEQGMRQVEGLEIEAIEPVEISGREVLSMRYQGVIFGFDCRFLALAFLHEGKRVEVTISVLRQRWDEREPVVEAVFEGIEFD